MKKLVALMLCIIFVFSVSGCSKEREKIVVVDGADVVAISDERIHELVKANNDVVSTIYGEPMFFNIAEMECHIAEFYIEDIITQYCDSGVFYEEDGKVLCRIKTDEMRENISKMEYEILSDSIYFNDDTQTFKVRYYSEYTVYVIEFKTEYNFDLNDWVLTDILL